MNDIKAIREAFSKGNVVVNYDGVAVFYTYKERWVTQSFADDAKDTLENLIANSDGFLISIVNGKYVKFVFQFDGISQDIVFYQPLENEISLEEMKAILDNDPNKNDGFIDFLIGDGITDEYEILEKLIERFNENGGTDNPQIINLSNIARWKRMMEIYNKLFDNRFIICKEIDEPDGDSSGFITLQFDMSSKFPNPVVGEDKKLLAEMVGFSSEVSFECSINDGFLNIIFAS